MLIATTGRHSSQVDKIAGAINFFNSTLDDDSSEHLVSRLLDRRDNFGIEEVQDIVEWMIEEWTGHPTVQSSASTPSRPTGGKTSTRSTSKLT
jgi:hypothetical protein